MMVFYDNDLEKYINLKNFLTFLLFGFSFAQGILNNLLESEFKIQDKN